MILLVKGRWRVCFITSNFRNSFHETKQTEMISFLHFFSRIYSQVMLVHFVLSSRMLRIWIVSKENTHYRKGVQSCNFNYNFYDFDDFFFFALIITFIAILRQKKTSCTHGIQHLFIYVNKKSNGLWLTHLLIWSKTSSNFWLH